MVQWLRLHLPMLQGHQFRSLVRELDPTCLMGQKTQTENSNNIATKAVKTLKMVHIKQNLF